MAIVFPSVLPDYIRRDPFREAEVYVYDQLRAQLPDSYRCYYSRPWLGVTAQGEEKEGEADFVIAHPELGLLVVEVKGGGVRRLEGSEQWVSRNRHGITNNIKDPVKQASDSKHVLLKKLQDHPAWGGQWVTARHGVIFPDCAPQKRDLGVGMPIFLFAFSTDMDRLAEWVEGRLSRHDEESSAGHGLKAGGMQVLHSLLSGPIELRSSLQRSLKADQREIERLSREQLDVLTSLENQPQMSISGGAGTGKTILAIEKACRLGEAGERVLVTCFNQPLGEHLRTLTRGCPNVQAGSFHSVAAGLAKSACIDLPPASSPNYFTTTLPNALLDAVKARPDLAFDAIVVDEGQDFQDGWLMALRLSLKDTDSGSFYVFFDDNQKVYARDSGFLAELPPARYYLTRNLRNTKAIHDSSRPWYSSPRISRPAGPDGEPVSWRAVAGAKDLRSAVAATLSDLLGTHKVDRGSIAVLTAGVVAGHPLVEGGRLCDLPFSPADHNNGDTLVFDTVRRFKGLDRPVVMVVNAERLSDPELIYTALSRPSVLLYVFGPKKDLDRIRSGKQSNGDASYV
jgi:hypothetical protein